MGCLRCVGQNYICVCRERQQNVLIHWVGGRYGPLPVSNHSSSLGGAQDASPTRVHRHLLMLAEADGTVTYSPRSAANTLEQWSPTPTLQA